MTLLQVVFILVFVVVILGVVWWLLITTEGVYLGRRMVIWLYDIYATRYDDIKQYHSEYEHWFLANPLMGAISPHTAPLVLDAATGTGRLPLTLCSHPMFNGRVIGVDLSHKMLTKAAEKLQKDRYRVDLVQWTIDDLPFEDDTFDVVTCLEALEFTPEPDKTLRELVRVLRPGGILLITNRIGRHMMPGKTWSDEALRTLLESSGMVHVTFEAWQVDYHKVWAVKAGDSLVSGARPLDEVLYCPACHGSLMMRESKTWHCPNCGVHAPISANGIVELASIADTVAST